MDNPVSQSYAFFLGSGISFKTFKQKLGRKNTVQDLTDALFSEPEKYKKGKALLKDLKDLLTERLKPFSAREANYEDIYAALYQIDYFYSSDFYNPLIADFVKQFESFLDEKRKSWIGYSSYCPTEETRLNVIINLTNYINTIIYKQLTLGKSFVVEGLDLLKSLFETDCNIDIFTLNHDLIVEELLKDTPYSDGFDSSGIHSFALSSSDDLWKEKIKLIKLHGSINWKAGRYERNRGGYDFWKKSDDQGQAPEYSEFLSGTRIKEEFYNLGIIGNMFKTFFKQLENHNRLIVSGYGWGDLGINRIIQRWAGGTERKVIVLDENLDKDKYPLNDISPNVIHINRYLCDFSSIDELESLISKQIS